MEESLSRKESENPDFHPKSEVIWTLCVGIAILIVALQQAINGKHDLNASVALEDQQQLNIQTQKSNHPGWKLDRSLRNGELDAPVPAQNEVATDYTE